MIRNILLTVLAAVTFSASLPAATIFVVRHAERAEGGMSTDVPISAAGEVRAKELARVLKDAGVKFVFTTELQRTRQTAAPLAERLGVTPVVVPAKDLKGLIERLRALGPDDVALVVGHSNTVPVIVEQLSGEAASAMSDTEFDRLTVVNTGGKGQVVVLRFGAQ